MTAEEAIRYIEILKKVLRKETNSDFSFADEYDEALKIAVEIMDKEIPYEPVEETVTENLHIYMCPRCKTPHILIKYLNRCDICGQTIEWEWVKEKEQENHR